MVSIEDPFDQDDWEGYAKLTASTSIQIVGDDLLVTNPKRISTAIDKAACNGLLLKVNQIGSVTEAIKAHNMAKEQGWGTMVSHRYLSQIQIPEDGKQKEIQILALSGLVRLRIASLLTLSSDLEPVRSRLVLPAGIFGLKTIQ